jgi:hypothetical protein
VYPAKDIDVFTSCTCERDLIGNRIFAEDQFEVIRMGPNPV